MSMKMKTWANKLELLAPKQEEQYYLSVQEWLKQDYLTMATASMSGHVHCLPLIDDDDKTTCDVIVQTRKPGLNLIFGRETFDCYRFKFSLIDIFFYVSLLSFLKDHKGILSLLYNNM